VRNFGVPDGAAATVGLALPLVELAVAIALIPEPSARWAALAALLLLLGFMAGIANALRRGDAPDCHCFGQIHSAPAGRGTLVRNGLFAAIAAVVVVDGPGPAIDSWVSARDTAELVAIGAGAVALIFGLLLLQLWLDRRQLREDLGVAQRIAASAPPGVPIGAKAPELGLKDLGGEPVTLSSLRERGHPILLMFMGPGCPSCAELVPKLAGWQRSLAERLTIAVISQGPAEDHDGWTRLGLQNILLQERYEAAEAYRIRATPSAVIVTPTGTVGSNPGESVFGIEPLIRLALRDGSEALVAVRSTA
jgi:thiol-disulfide isomerase/thioredoxin